MSSRPPALFGTGRGDRDASRLTARLSWRSEIGGCGYPNEVGELFGQTVGGVAAAANSHDDGFVARAKPDHPCSVGLFSRRLAVRGQVVRQVCAATTVPSGGDGQRQRRRHGSATGQPRIEIGIDCQEPGVLVPLTGAPAVYLQRVSESKMVKNRLHFDLFTDEPEALVERLANLGGTRLGEPFGKQPVWDWLVMADPEGNEFCVCRENPGD